MRREFSAGGVLVRRLRRPLDDGGDPARPASREGLWALPEGPDRRGREQRGRRRCARSREETGAHGRSLGKLGDIRYWFNWDGERVFKVVSFFLVRYEGGRLGDIPEAFRHEVAEVRWLPLDEAPALLAYRGEREMAERALARLSDRDTAEDV